ncbi:putative aminoglycoside phosphotransferase, partial [Mycobacterium rhizamassiliense]
VSFLGRGSPVSATSLSVPKTWDDITPEWMSAALAADFPGAQVDTVGVELRDDGTNRRARLGVTYREGAGPATVFVKAADPAHKAMIRLTSGMFHEPRLFTCGVDLPLEHPAVHAALIDEADYDFVLVMEDLRARGADPRDGTRPMTVDEVTTGVRGLGRMHGKYWGERVLREPALGWLEPFVTWEGMQAAPLPVALERLGDDAPAEVLSLGIDELIESIWKPYIRTLTTSPQTLLHGDPHIGNTYLLPSGEVGFLDWQVARRGNWSLDLGYFLQGALTVEDRRASERALLGEYRDALALPAGELPSADEIWLRYRASVAHGLTLWLVTASAGEWQRTDVSVALAQRYSFAYADLEAASALAAISG